MQPNGGRRVVKKPASFSEYDAEALNALVDGAANGWVTSSPERKTGLGGRVSQLPGGGGIFKSAAAEVLRRERRLMTTGEITKMAIEHGFLKAQGKTPEATMASALYTDVKKKNGLSNFTRPQEGLFGLREWLKEGFYPEGFFAGGGIPMGFDEEAIAAASNPSFRRRTNTPPIRQVRERHTKHKARQTWQTEASDDNHSDWAHANSHRATRENSPSGSSSGDPSSHADPLHMLGDACMDHDRHEGDAQGNGGATIGRKRPALALETEGHDTQHQQQRQLPLPSPGDRLLTLHEVATSPQPYAPKSFIGADLTIQHSDSKQRKKLSVAIPHDNGAEALARPGALHAALDTAGRLFEGQGLLDLVHGAPESATAATAAAAAMLLQSPLGQMFSMMAARTSKGAITPWPYGHNFLSPNGAYMGDPLATPSTFAAAGLDMASSDLLGHLAHNLGLGAGMGGLTALTPMGSALLGPQGRRSLSQLLGVLGAGAAAAGATGAAGAVGGVGGAGEPAVKVEQPSPRLASAVAPQQMNFASQPDVSQTAIRSAKRPASAAKRTAGGRASSQHNMASGTQVPNVLAGLQYPATKGLSDAAQLENWQQLIEAAEAQWGISHPAVGRAWLELARALQAAAKDSERARQATRKAWTVCQTLMGASKQLGSSVEVEQSFEYLLQRWDGFHRPSPIPMFKSEPAQRA